LEDLQVGYCKSDLYLTLTQIIMFFISGFCVNLKIKSEWWFFDNWRFEHSLPLSSRYKNTTYLFDSFKK